MAKSKFFRVAVEGATTDGRTIERAWLTGMATTYNPEKYGARIFAEHIRGVTPDGPFRAYGDVTAIKAEEIADGELKGKMGLFAQIEPSDAMVALVKSGQKIYTSMEIDTDFAGSKTPYLVGLGITDSPASLGTEVLTFAAQHPEANPYAARKQSPDNLFTASEEAMIEWESEPADASASTLFAAVKAKLAKLTGKAKGHDADFAEVRHALEEVADVLGQFADNHAAVSQQFADQVAALAARLDAIESDAQQQATAFAAFRAEVEAAPAGPRRPVATGGVGGSATNC